MSGQTFSLGFYTSDPAYQLSGWIEPAFGPATVNGQVLTFNAAPALPQFQLTANQTYYFALYEQPSQPSSIFTLGSGSQSGQDIYQYAVGNGTMVGTLTGPSNGNGKSLAVDAYQDVFVARNNAYLGNLGSVSYYPAGNYASPVTISTGVTYPDGIMIDSAQNLIVANSCYYVGGDILVFPAGQYATATPLSIPSQGGFQYLAAVATDSSNHIFAADNGRAGGAPKIYEFSGTTQSAVISGVPSVSDLAVDQAGDLFVLTATSVLEYPAGAYASETPITIALGSIPPTSLAIDGSSNLYIGTGYGTLLEYPAGDYGASTPPNVFVIDTRFGAMSFDASGDLFVAAQGGGVLEYAAGSFSSGSPISYALGAPYGVAGETFPHVGRLGSCNGP